MSKKNRNLEVQVRKREIEKKIIDETFNGNTAIICDFMTRGGLSSEKVANIMGYYAPSKMGDLMKNIEEADLSTCHRNDLMEIWGDNTSSEEGVIEERLDDDNIVISESVLNSVELSY